MPELFYSCGELNVDLIVLADTLLVYFYLVA